MRNKSIVLRVVLVVFIFEVAANAFLLEHKTDPWIYGIIASSIAAVMGLSHIARRGKD